MQRVALSRLFAVIGLHFPAILLLALPAPHLTAAPLRALPTEFHIDFSRQPDPAALLAHPVVFLDGQTEASLEPARALGHSVYARLPLVAVPPQSTAAERAQLGGFLLPARGQAWNQRLLDILHPEWLHWAVHEVAQNAAERGFHGFLLSGADMLAALDQQRPGHELEHRKAWVRLVLRLRKQFPDKALILHQGPEFLQVLSPYLQGFFLDGVFRNPSAEEKDPAAALASEKLIRRAQSLGLRVFAAEWGSVTDPAGNRTAAERLQRLGCVTCVTTPALDGRELGPLLAAPRQVLVVHGWDSEAQAQANPPSEHTWTARTLAPALRWFGQEPHYLTVADWQAAVQENRAGTLLAEHSAGVVIDPETVVAPEFQGDFARWLITARQSDIPLVLAAQPLTEASAWNHLAQTLGLQGSGQECQLDSRSRLLLGQSRREWLQTGAAPEATAFSRIDVLAPADSTVILSYQSPTTRQRADSLFVAPWGGALLTPSARAQVEPFRFLEATLWRDQAGPVADTTTLAGRAIFLSTVQGRGFCEPSWLPGAPLCAEVLQQELSQRTLLPTTVALAEADVRAWSAASQPTEGTRYEAIARALFSLPQVEPAANSFSRPANWHAEHLLPGSLRDVLPDSRRGLEREIVGSLDYIQRRLTPPGKKTAFFLWPEGAEPSHAALALLSHLKVPHLAGSWQSGWHVGAAALSSNRQAIVPRTVEGTTRRGHNPLTAEATAQSWLDQHRPGPQNRRLSPIHLAYAIGDLKDPANVEALRRIWDWCETQPLHPMTASTYARFIDDAALVRVYPQSANRWLAITSGRACTLRLPARLGLPDLARCIGVTGWSQQGDQLYLHLSGHQRNSIVLSPDATPAPHVHLVEADRAVDFHHLGPDSARFRLSGRDEAVVILGGLTPDSAYTITAGGLHSLRRSDAQGRLALAAPPLATISIQPHTAPPYAAR